ncbi:myeloid differentiation primary response protein MyD88-like [Oculina patagonica]
MEAPRKGRFQNLKNKTFRMLRRKRRRAAHDKKSGIHGTGVNEIPSPPPPPTLARSDEISEDSELSSTANPSCDKTVELPQEDESESTSKKEEQCPTTVDIPSARSKKRLKDMSTEGHQMLCLLLQPKTALGNDYRLLAAKMGYTNDYIKYLGSTNEPVKELITEYEKGDRKIVELESLLKEIERYAVVEDLQKYIEATPTPEELEERVQNRERIEELKTSRESYHAFICFAEKDREFVDKLVKIMESAPYNFHLCLSERDFVPGGSIYETTAVAIEQRCKKFVVILSRNFDDSEGSHYESHIAMNLSPGAKQKRLIPVLIEEAYRYKIPRTISHITYLDWLRQEEKNFWNLLAISLGWEPKKQLIMTSKLTAGRNKCCIL